MPRKLLEETSNLKILTARRRKTLTCSDSIVPQRNQLGALLVVRNSLGRLTSNPESSGGLSESARRGNSKEWPPAVKPTATCALDKLPTLLTAASACPTNTLLIVKNAFTVLLP